MFLKIPGHLDIYCFTKPGACERRDHRGAEKNSKNSAPLCLCGLCVTDIVFFSTTFCGTH